MVVLGGGVGWWCGGWGGFGVGCVFLVWFGVWLVVGWGGGLVVVGVLCVFAWVGVWRIFGRGLWLRYGEVLVMDICDGGVFTDELFAVYQPVCYYRVLGALYSINGKW
ncbi:hypothetical protein RA276_28040 [Pseudomonas syringae pv. tagetis]|uniref:hypothetical protein n=1 Tax=Pseudomonas syringae group genomosp. 7 TaxID=251699 RepID=UPI00376FB6B9